MVDRIELVGKLGSTFKTKLGDISMTEFGFTSSSVDVKLDLKVQREMKERDLRYYYGLTYFTSFEVIIIIMKCRVRSSVSSVPRESILFRQAHAQRLLRTTSGRKSFARTSTASAGMQGRSAASSSSSSSSSSSANRRFKVKVTGPTPRKSLPVASNVSSIEGETQEDINRRKSRQRTRSRSLI